MDQAAPLPEWRADHSAARVLLAITGQQRLEGALIGGAREELLTIDQIEQAHWLAAQGMDDVPVVDQVGELLSPGGSPVLGFAPDSALEQSGFELSVPLALKLVVSRKRELDWGHPNWRRRGHDSIVCLRSLGRPLDRERPIIIVGND